MRTPNKIIIYRYPFSTDISAAWRTTPATKRLFGELPENIEYVRTSVLLEKLKEKMTSKNVDIIDEIVDCIQCL